MNMLLLGPWGGNYFDSACHTKGSLNASDIVWGVRPYLIFSLCYKVKVILKRKEAEYFIIINRKRGGVGWFTSLRSSRLARHPFCPHPPAVPFRPPSHMIFRTLLWLKAIFNECVKMYLAVVAQSHQMSSVSPLFPLFCWKDFSCLVGHTLRATYVMSLKQTIQLKKQEHINNRYKKPHQRRGKKTIQDVFYI